MRHFYRAIIAVIIVFANTMVFASNPQYTIIIDAGSSGSRLHLFQYEATEKLPVIQEIFSEETKPGISSFNNPADAAASLTKLFDNATVQLNNRHIDPSSVSVNVLATAGMRLLPNDKAQETYDAIRSTLQKNYSFKVDEVATVPEKMEGVYGWLDVNYLLHHFEHDTDTTVGIIDMGGASTEIAFSTRDASRPDDVVNMTINGISYRVFSKNFLGLGQDQTRNAMNTNALAAACYPVNYSLASVTGSFNLAACNSLYADIIKQHHVVETMLPITNQQHFVAYSGVYYDYQFLDVNNNPLQENVEQRVQSVCSQSWDQLKTNYANVQEKYLANYCANSVYVTSLLFGAYQLQNGQLEVKNKIDDKGIDWTLGALLHKLIT